MSHVPGQEGLTREIEEILLFGKAYPLPRYSTKPAANDGKHEVLVVGAGPAGLFLTLNLARLGLTDDSVLCVDAKVALTTAGHADGVNGRTLEILRSLGLEGDIVREGGYAHDIGVWRRPDGDPNNFFRESISARNETPVRFGDFRLFHQGRIERLFTEDLARYSKRGVQYRTKLLDLAIDESDPEYPVKAVVERDGWRRTVRAKYLVGADGARSLVRKQMGIEQGGQSLPRVWGVVDCVVETDFPDIRRVVQLPGHLGKGRGHAFIIPRERLGTGDKLTRFYVDMTDYAESPEGMSNWREYRASITLDMILQKIASKLSPYQIGIKKDTKAHWWAAYPIAQRVSLKQIVRDAHNWPRVFLIGDSAHSHSPSQGLGMNTGIQDAYNLSWKLAYSLQGLAPSPSALLSSYEEERLPVAKDLVRFDREWNSTAQTEASMDARMKEMAEFVTTCGIEYGEGLAIRKPSSDFEVEGRYPIKGTSYLKGILRSGRRIVNTKPIQYATSIPWDLQDDLESNGRWRVFVFCGADFLRNRQRSDSPQIADLAAETVKENRTKDEFDDRSISTLTTLILSIIPSFPPLLVEAVILQPKPELQYKWADLPKCVKEHAEMRLYGAGEGVYETYGVDRDRGAVVVVRPDGVVGMIVDLEDIKEVDEFLGDVIVKRIEGKGHAVELHGYGDEDSKIDA